MNKQILRLAIPNILSNLTVPLVSCVDTALVGRLTFTYYLGAVALGSMIFNSVFWAFEFIRMGTTGLTAQAYGRKDEKDCITILSRSLTLSLLAGLILTTSHELISAVSFKLIHSAQDVEFFAKSYFAIRIYAAPATLITSACQGWFLGMQNAKYPLIITLTVNLLNIVLSYYFINYAGMASDGAAVGTFYAQYTGLFLTVFLFLKRYRYLLTKLDRKHILVLSEIKKFLQINFDIFLRTAALIFTYAFFMAKSAEFGENLLAANAVLMQLWMLMAYGVDGFAFAAESLVGRFVGAQDRDNLVRVLKRIFIWGAGLGLTFSLTYFTFAEGIIRIFTDKEIIIDLALSYISWTILGTIISSLCFVWDGIYLGATATRAMRNMMIIALFLVFLPAVHLLAPMKNTGLWISLIVYVLMRGLLQTIFARKCILSRV